MLSSLVPGIRVADSIAVEDIIKRQRPRAIELSNRCGVRRDGGYGAGGTRRGRVRVDYISGEHPPDARDLVVGGRYRGDADDVAWEERT